ncbi:MAG: 50S ribosomal protein L17, partial [Planctomycetes bacterium]|nr:50S ribosomal protein L17 [Planctomycetota bacterium]
MAGKRLGRTTSHRLAMWRNMAAALFQHEAIQTTERKAKEVRRFVEKLITTAKKGSLHARRQVIARLGRDRVMVEIKDDKEEVLDKTVVQKLFDEIAPRYADRPGGYTRIIHLPERRIGDAGRQVVLELVEEEIAAGEGSATGAGRRRRRAAKRRAAAGRAARPGAAEAATTDETHADESAAEEPQSADTAQAPQDA